MSDINKSADNTDFAVKVENVSKSFRLPHEKHTSVKSAFINFYRKKTYETQKALDDISFEIKKGEFFGIVGRNGSGKSTLLKILAGIYEPDKGEVKVRGKLVPFIELGVGFNPELTGRENVFLNGALLGFSRRQMDSMYNDIVEFAELGKFMDQRLKNYSSGMQVRLAFSIAIRAEGDILLLDEVLAVGDASFQRKCIEYFRKIKQTDKTIVLVTHGMGTIEEYCDRALMLENSKIVTIGSPTQVSLQYQLSNSVDSTRTAGRTDKNKERPSESIVKIEKISVSSPSKRTREFNLTDDVVVNVELMVKKEANIQVSVALYNMDGDYVSGISSKNDIPNFMPKPGNHKLACTIKAGQFPPGPYRLRVVVTTDDEDSELIDVVSYDYGVQTPVITFAEKSEYQKGMFYMSAKWRVDK